MQSQDSMVAGSFDNGGMQPNYFMFNPQISGSNSFANFPNTMGMMGKSNDYGMMNEPPEAFDPARKRQVK